jgi:hypothetical protein
LKAGAGQAVRNAAAHMHANRVAGRSQMASHRRAHDAQADESELES